MNTRNRKRWQNLIEKDLINPIGTNDFEK